MNEQNSPNYWCLEIAHSWPIHTLILGVCQASVPWLNNRPELPEKLLEKLVLLRFLSQTPCRHSEEGKKRVLKRNIPSVWFWQHPTDSETCATRRKASWSFTKMSFFREWNTVISTKTVQCWGFPFLAMLRYCSFLSVHQKLITMSAHP